MGPLCITSILGRLALIGALVYTTTTSIQPQVGHILLHDSKAELRGGTIIIPRLVEGSRPGLRRRPTIIFYTIITSISPFIIPNSISTESGPSFPAFVVSRQDFLFVGPTTSATASALSTS
eukprot:TRINITY_DN5776_c0_g4_i6.p3 TRINITY_DN5776_c0_g4~~TRINITY_DN5776_c0_g4_i6.p3  ORF type:complete len:121 (+),score=14.98 TRINITY_DN5776_c0_g4_i6:732-1094(+)